MPIQVKTVSNHMTLQMIILHISWSKLFWPYLCGHFRVGELTHSLLVGSDFYGLHIISHTLKKSIENKSSKSQAKGI